MYAIIIVAVRADATSADLYHANVCVPASDTKSASKAFRYNNIDIYIRRGFGREKVWRKDEGPYHFIIGVGKQPSLFSERCFTFTSHCLSLELGLDALLKA